MPLKEEPESIWVCMANEIDERIGRRVAERRQELGLSQEELAKVLSVSSNDMRAFEQGQERISARLLQALTTVLKVPVTFFFGNNNADKNGKGMNLSIFLPIAISICSLLMSSRQ